MGRDNAALNQLNPSIKCPAFDERDESINYQKVSVLFDELGRHNGILIFPVELISLAATHFPKFNPIIDLCKRGKTAVEPPLKHDRASLSLIQHPADNPLSKQQRPFDQPVLTCINRKLGVSAKHAIRQGTRFQHSLYSVFHPKTTFICLSNIDPQTTFLDNISLYHKSWMPKSIFLSVRRYAHPPVNRQIPIPKRI